MHLQKKHNDDAMQRDDARVREDERRKKEEEERRKIRVNPDPRTREAASLANAFALPVAVHKPQLQCFVGF